MKRRVGDLALELWLPVAVVLFWWFASENSHSPYWPPLHTILSTFKNTWLFARAGSDLAPSMERFAVGFVIALVLGVVVGTALGLSPLLRRMFEPIADFLRSLPPPALLPIVIVVLGVGATSKVFIIAFGAIWPVLLNTIDGVRGTDPTMLEMSRVYGLSRGKQVRRVILPAASPQIFVGTRLALSIALILMVISEMFGSTNGLGYFVLLSQQTFAIPQMWSGIILIGIIGYLVNLLFVLGERRALAWHRGWRAATLAQRPASRSGQNRRRGRRATLLHGPESSPTHAHHTETP